MASDIDLLRSPKAIPCHRQVHSDCGGATVHCVVLADGFIVECGSDGYAEKRAKLLSEAINAGDPAAFDLRGRR